MLATIALTAAMLTIATLTTTPLLWMLWRLP